VVFVGSEARGYCEVAPTFRAGLSARGDIAKAEAGCGCPQWDDSADAITEHVDTCDNSGDIRKDRIAVDGQSAHKKSGSRGQAHVPSASGLF
jgi:hypothetical protein